MPSVSLASCPEITEDAMLAYCFGSAQVNRKEKLVEVTKSSRRKPGWRILRLCRPVLSSEFLRNLIKVVLSIVLLTIQ